jgi:GT2 family glycosyltransferase
MTDKRFLAEAYRARFPDLQKIAEEDPAYDLARHFATHGLAESRHLSAAPAAGVDAAFVSGGGFVLVSGWIDDSVLRRHLFAEPPLQAQIAMSFHEVPVPADAILRTYRRDVKEARGLLEDADLGFVMFFRLPEGVPPGDRMELTLTCGGRKTRIAEIAPRIVSDGYLVSYYLGFFKALESGRHHMTGCMEAYGRHGATLVALWRDHLAGTGVAGVLDLGAPAGPPAFSALTVFFGKLEFLHAQAAALYPRLAEAGGELVAVVNSPGLATQAGELLRYAHAVHGLPVRLVAMEGNAGFGHANNLAASLARSDRLLCLNPDVFPMARTDWAAFSARMAALGDREVVGARLHYADGSVMHDGMTILADPVPRRMPPARPLFADLLLRVDHPLKGAPEGLAGTPEGAGPRPVQAVTGSFLMIRRGLFEDLGGFATDYVHAYYEDADLCLRAGEAGAAVLCDPALSFIHLEGRGSGHDGPGPARPAMLFNRCLFTERHAARLFPGGAA